MTPVHVGVIKRYDTHIISIMFQKAQRVRTEYGLQC